jgi:hypothetical protein
MGAYSAFIGIDLLFPKTLHRDYTPVKPCEKHEGDYTF